MTDQPMAVTPENPKLTVYTFREGVTGNRYIDHKHFAAVADAMLRLNHTEFKLLCADLHAGSNALGKDPRDVEDNLFEYANRIMDESNNSK